MLNNPSLSLPYVLFLSLLCKDGNFFRRGKSWEVEPEPECAKCVWWSVLVPFGSATLPHLASPYKGEEKNCKLLGHVWSVLFEQVLQHARSVLDQRVPGRPIMALTRQDPAECFFMIAFSIGVNGVGQARATRDCPPHNLRRPSLDHKCFAPPLRRGFRIVPRPVHLVLVTKTVDRAQQTQKKTEGGSDEFDRRCHLRTKPRKNVQGCQGSTLGTSDTVTSVTRRQDQKAYLSPKVSAQY